MSELRVRSNLGYFISFEGETEAQQIAGMLQSEEEAVKRMASSSHTPNPKELFSSSMSNIPTDPLSSPEEINGLENRLTNATILNPPTLALTSSVDVNSITSVSLDGKWRRKYDFQVVIIVRLYTLFFTPRTYKMIYFIILKLSVGVHLFLAEILI